MGISLPPLWGVTSSIGWTLLEVAWLIIIWERDLRRSVISFIRTWEKAWDCWNSSATMI